MRSLRRRIENRRCGGVRDGSKKSVVRGHGQFLKLRDTEACLNGWMVSSHCRVILYKLSQSLPSWNFYSYTVKTLFKFFFSLIYIKYVYLINVYIKYNLDYRHASVVKTLIRYYVKGQAYTEIKRSGFLFPEAKKTALSPIHRLSLRIYIFFCSFFLGFNVLSLPHIDSPIVFLTNNLLFPIPWHYLHESSVTT